MKEILQFIKSFDYIIVPVIYLISGILAGMLFDRVILKRLKNSGRDALAF